MTLCTGKAELGQGLRSAIARIGAEELDVAPARIRVQTADTTEAPNEFFTAGSQSIEDSGAAIRQAAAEARHYLLQRAAERLGVTVEQLQVDDGTVWSVATTQRTTYWELFGGQLFHQPVTGAAQPKAVADHRIVGKPGTRIDLVGLGTGRTRFVQDLTRPGMLHGRIVRPPGPHAQLAGIDTTAAERLTGVVAVVRDGSFLGIIAEREEHAVAGMEMLRQQAQWETCAGLPVMDELHTWLRAQAARSYRVVDGVPVEGAIEAIATPAAAARTLCATYTRPYHMHASIGSRVIGGRGPRPASGSAAAASSSARTPPG